MAVLATSTTSSQAAAEADEFRAAVLAGLGRKQKEIPAKFFYDAEGSCLFERICELDEYYPTRTDIAVLREHAGEMLAGLTPGRAVLVEFGSGASVKVRLLLDALEPACYVPIDISGEHLHAAAEQLAQDYPDLPILPVCADFTRPFGMPPSLPEGPRLGFFPGSTIGNFHPAEAVRILSGFAHRLGPDGRLLIGVDLKKDPRVLHAAYNDAAGVTAAFNMNLLVRINRELGGTFGLDAFRHEAFYNADAGRIEMHLVSLRNQTVRLSGRAFAFAAGETIHTENSYKYSIDEFVALAATAGYRPIGVWTDPARLFSNHLLAVNGG